MNNGNDTVVRKSAMSPGLLKTCRSKEILPAIELEISKVAQKNTH
jgi:hypothetical protein